jgi:hypothetical protein
VKKNLELAVPVEEHKIFSLQDGLKLPRVTSKINNDKAFFFFILFFANKVKGKK